MDFIVGLVVSLIAPQAPAYVKTIISAALPLVFDLAKDITSMIQKSGFDKQDVAEVAASVRDLLDESLDTVPGWADLSEAKRDTVLDALEILTVWCAELADQDGDKKITPAQLKAAATKVRKGFRRAGRKHINIKAVRRGRRNV